MSCLSSMCDMATGSGGERAVERVMFVESLADMPELGVIPRSADLLAVTCGGAIR